MLWIIFSHVLWEKNRRDLYNALLYWLLSLHSSRSSVFPAYSSIKISFSRSYKLGTRMSSTSYWVLHSFITIYLYAKIHGYICVFMDAKESQLRRIEWCFSLWDANGSCTVIAMKFERLLSSVRRLRLWFFFFFPSYSLNSSTGTSQLQTFRVNFPQLARHTLSMSRNMMIHSRSVLCCRPQCKVS